MNILKEKLRTECSRFFTCETIQDSYELLDIYIEFLFLVVKNHHHEPVYTNPNADAKMVVQMMLTKALHLKSVVGGISYQAKNGSVLNKIIDPTIVASLIRNLYETVGLFNLIYRNTKTQDEKIILYSLWVHSGLQYRQRFESLITMPENHKKCEDEKKSLVQLVKIIEDTELFKRLDEKNQKKIRARLKDKEYLMMFDNEKVMFLHWQQLTEVMNCKEGILDNIYTYFSLYSHPSNVAVFQFADFFKIGVEEYLKTTNFNLKYYFMLTSIFIADYIKLFPQVQNTFESLSVRDQIVIDFYNTFIRGSEFSINEPWQAAE